MKKSWINPYKAIRFCGAVLLALFAVTFALMGICSLVIGIGEGDITCLAISALTCFISYVCWSVRRDI